MERKSFAKDKNGDPLYEGDYVKAHITDDEKPFIYGKVYKGSDKHTCEITRADGKSGGGAHDEDAGIRRWLTPLVQVERMSDRERGPADMDPDRVQFFHELIEEGVKEISDHFNEEHLPEGMDPIDEEQREQMENVLKQIVPFMSIPQSMIIASVIMSLATTAMVHKFMEEHDLDETDFMMMVQRAGMAEKAGDQGPFNMGDTESVKRQVTLSEPMSFSDEEDPADAIMRLGRQGNN